MPTYEYRCPAGHDFEKFYRKMSEAQAELPCPVCGAVATRRVSAGAGLLFKGSGFYITDYGKDGKKAQPAQTTAGSAESDSTGADAKGSEPKSGESKTGESKSAESRAGESTAGESRAGESKQTETRTQGGKGKPGGGSTT